MSSTLTQRRVVAATIAGNFVEWYDFAIYGFFAAQLGRAFFPGSDPNSGLLSTLAVFGVAFVFRPIGAAICGYLGDRFGRRKVLAAVILVMSSATFLIGILPSYATIGVWAPVILVVLRLIQGLSAGGEFGGATSLLFEHSPPQRRGLIGSTQPASLVAALAISASIGAGISQLMSQEVLDSWGWRIPFLAALPLGIIGLYIRTRVEESPQFAAVESGAQHALSESPFKEVVTTYWKQIIFATLAIVSWTAGGYVTVNFLPTYFSGVLHRPSWEGLIASTTALSVYAVCNVGSGWLSDRYTRWKVMLAGAIATAIAAIPGYLLLVDGSFLAVAGAVIMFPMLLSLCAGPTPAFLSELVPTHVRNSFNSITYALANSLFGGFAPYIVTWVIFKTDLAIAPAFYLIGVQVIGVIGLVCTAAFFGQGRHANVAPVSAGSPQAV